jgi:hypothetical protein
MSRAPRLDVHGLGAPEDAVRFLATILAASTEHSMLAIDPAGRIVGFNPGARWMYGYLPSEISERPTPCCTSRRTSRRGFRNR